MGTLGQLLDGSQGRLNTTGAGGGGAVLEGKIQQPRVQRANSEPSNNTNYRTPDKCLAVSAAAAANESVEGGGRSQPAKKTPRRRPMTSPRAARVVAASLATAGDPGRIDKGFTGTLPTTPTSIQPPTSIANSGLQTLIYERQDSNLSTGSSDKDDEKSPEKNARTPN